MAIQAGGVTFSRHNKKVPLPKGGNQTPMASEDLTPWQPSASDPWDMKKVRHLGRRAGFGLRPEEAETLTTVGHKLAIDIFLLVPHHTIPERGTYLLPNGEVVNLSNYGHQVATWLWLMNNSPWQLQEKMAMFWHDHFSIGVGTVRYPELLARHVNWLRRLSLSPFKFLLLAVTIDPGMLYFLDNRISTSLKPNENYAREIQELYSMGVGGGYTETDIQEAARALTGITNILDYQFYNARSHDNGSKTVLGKTLNNGSGVNAIVRDMVGVVDAILAHPSTATYMVTKIWEYFVYENPSQALVDKLAARWRKDNYDIRALMETIFRSKAFYSTAAMRTLVKNPAEYVVGMMRNTYTTNISYIRTANRFLGMGLPLLNYPGPEGMPDGTAWINSQNVFNRINYATQFIQQRDWPRNSPRGPLLSTMNPEREIKRKNLDTATPDAIVDYYLELLTDSSVPKKVRDDLVAYMTKTNTGTRTWSYATQPARELNQKVSNLIHLIQGLPEAHIN